MIDLLPERTAGVVEQWLREHPSVEVISRDRAGAYAEGATNGAPQAVQVADRFHVLQNLREALQRLLDRHQRALQAIQVPARRPDSVPGAATPAPSGTPADRGVLDGAARGREPTDAPSAGSMDSLPAVSGELNQPGTRVERRASAVANGGTRAMRR